MVMDVSGSSAPLYRRVQSAVNASLGLYRILAAPMLHRNSQHCNRRILDTWGLTWPPALTAMGMGTVFWGSE